MESFLANPTFEGVEKLSRKVLVSVVKELKSDYSVTQKSEVLRDKIVVHFINEGVFDESLLAGVLLREEKPLEKVELEARIALEKEKVALEKALKEKKQQAQ